MSGTAIKVENVSKVFRIYDRPSDRLKEIFSIRRQKFHSDYPALKDVSFEVNQGEFLGIVGRNGAGKSTLLKILSRELTPTSGSVMINGKVSLLQLGVGFDPELTGLDNARFASKLLGYNDQEIEGMLEEIVAFADIGEFIHHPVKTYSSGMYSRLSFAVGININPDILIADEVLSVGDMRFSQKCLRKMREFKDQGKTVIFVSHDIQSVNAFCDTAMWIKDGTLFLHGDAKQITMGFQNYMLYEKLPDEYHSVKIEGVAVDKALSAQNDNVIKQKTESDLESVKWIAFEALPSVGDGRAEIKRMSLLREGRQPAHKLKGDEELTLLLDIEFKTDMQNPQVGFVIYNRQGLPMLHTNNDICGMKVDSMSAGQRSYAAFRFKMPGLANGDYSFSIGIQTGLEMAHKIDEAYQFNVTRTDIKGTQCGYLIIENEHFEWIDVGCKLGETI